MVQQDRSWIAGAQETLHHSAMAVGTSGDPAAALVTTSDATGLKHAAVVSPTACPMQAHWFKLADNNISRLQTVDEHHSLSASWKPLLPAGQLLQLLLLPLFKRDNGMYCRQLCCR